MKSRTLFLGLSLLLLHGCSSISYYSQSVQGHWQVWWPQQPASDLIADQHTDAHLKQRLQTALAIRQHASDALQLPRNDSYTGYTDLGRDHVLWNVVAAQEFSLQAKRWCYLVVGCLSYRGYFDQQQAQNYAHTLKIQGYDVMVGGVSAYSTLGWFDDPLLNSMMKWSDRQLAGLIFHELAHQVVYINGDTSFNEAFASAVERIGTLHWLAQQNPQQVNDYLAYLQQKAQFRALLLQTKQALGTLYASDKSDAEKRQQKAKLFQQLRANYQQQQASWRYPRAFNYWFQQPLNNARLVASMTYMEKLPAFYALYARSGGDWQAFYQEVKNMETLSQAERDTRINALLQEKLNLQGLLKKALI